MSDLSSHWPRDIYRELAVDNSVVEHDRSHFERPYGAAAEAIRRERQGSDLVKQALEMGSGCPMCLIEALTLIAARLPGDDADLVSAMGDAIRHIIGTEEDEATS